MPHAKRVAIIGSGPAGLMAAETLAGRGLEVEVFEAKPSLGRKFLMAGKSGLNITHTEPTADFLARYSAPDHRLRDMVAAFGADDIIAWMAGLGIAAHTGSTARVFPAMMKASPLLRAWLARLQAAGVSLQPRHRWTGWDASGALCFDTPDGDRTVSADATILALGGASWARLGADGAWAPRLAEAGVTLTPFAPSNCGFTADWSAHLRTRFAGHAVKAVALSVAGTSAHTRGEFVITRDGVESGGIYAVSAALRDQLASTGSATLMLDLAPDVSAETLAARLARPRGKQSLSNHLRKAARLSPVKTALLHECAPREAFDDAARLAALIKALPLRLTGTAPLDAAISTVGGVSWDSLDDGLMLRARPGVFCAGEMIDWDAPTGGYLITACLATGRAAGLAAARFLEVTA